LVNLFHLSIALGYGGLLIRATLDNILWRFDFISFYTGGTIIRHGMGSQLYELAIQALIQQNILGFTVIFYDGVLSYLNPPHFALLMIPFSLLPLNLAFWCWIALQIMVLILSIKRLYLITSDWNKIDRQLLFCAFLAFPPLGFQFLHGQLSSIILWFIIEFYLSIKNNKDFWAGFWLALAAIKPQFILFLIIMISASRRWWSLISLSIVMAIIFGMTAVMISPSIWLRYLELLVKTGNYFDRFGIYPKMMYNLKGTLTLILGSNNAPLIQILSLGILGIGMIGTSALWARTQWLPLSPKFDLYLAFTLILGAFLNPHQYLHDCLIITLPIVIFYEYLRRTNRSTRTLTVFLLTWPALFLIEEFVLRGYLGIRLPVVLIFILLVWIGINIFQ
jgi:hypothetical protein